MIAAQPNQFETAARGRKALAIIDALDRMAQSMGLDSGSEFFARMVEGFTSAHWEEAAQHAKVNTPSERTRQIVVFVLWGRSRRGGGR